MFMISCKLKNLWTFLYSRVLNHLEFAALARGVHLKLRLGISGGSLPLIFCIHMRSGLIYGGVIYLAKKIIR